MLRQSVENPTVSALQWGALARRRRRLRSYNQINRWRKAGVWDRLNVEIIKADDSKVPLIDTFIVRVHQQGATQPAILNGSFFNEAGPVAW